MELIANVCTDYGKTIGMTGRIRAVTITRTANFVQAKAEVDLAGVMRTITSTGQSTSPDVELSELRRQLYAVGFSKRAIASAVKNMATADRVKE